MRQLVHRSLFTYLAAALWLSIFSIAANAANQDTGNLAQLSQRGNFDALDSPHNHQQFIVHFGNLSDQRQAAEKLRNLISNTRASLDHELVEQRSISTGGHVVRVENKITGKQAKQLMLEILKDSDVTYVEPDALMTIRQTIPNDARFNQQWHYFEARAGIRAPNAWPIANGNRVRVAVIDTGITNHPDLNGNVIGGYDFISNAGDARDGNGRDANPADQGDWFNAGECGSGLGADSSWHGTHVAGTVAAVTNNALGVAGVAFGARIVPIRVLGKCGGRLSDIADAINWASGGTVGSVPNNPFPAQVINMSLGSRVPAACGTTYRNAINAAALRGTLVVVAAGNSNDVAANYPPGNCMNVMNVAALDRQGNRAVYSNFGANVDVSAPGGETGRNIFNPNGVLSTWNAGATVPGAAGYAFYEGTSMAAPHVAGIAALMWDVNPSLHSSSINSAIMNTARPIPGACPGGCGRGLVDATAAVTWAQPTTSPPGRPSGFRISTYGGGINVLSWYGNRDADNFQIYRGNSYSGSYSFVRSITSTSSTEYVTRNTYYKVRACNTFGCSSFTRPKLAAYRSCGGPGERPCE